MPYRSLSLGVCVFVCLFLTIPSMHVSSNKLENKTVNGTQAHKYTHIQMIKVKIVSDEKSGGSGARASENKDTFVGAALKIRLNRSDFNLGPIFQFKGNRIKIYTRCVRIYWHCNPFFSCSCFLIFVITFETVNIIYRYINK